MRIFVAIIIGIILAGCATDSVFEREYKQSFHGIVTKKTELSKTEIKQKLRELKNQRLVNTIVINAVTLTAGFILIPIGDITTDSHEYEVTLEGRRQVRVLNQFGGFDVGDCVAVFLSDNWDKYPPRMAYSTTECTVNVKRP